MTRGQWKRSNSTVSVPSTSCMVGASKTILVDWKANSNDLRSFCRGLTELSLKVGVVSGAGQKQHRCYWCGNSFAIENPRGGMILLIVRAVGDYCTPLKHDIPCCHVCPTAMTRALFATPQWLIRTDLHQMGHQASGLADVSRATK